jgi:hypothetical protein
VVVARSEIRAVRRVVKQLPVEVLQQCSSASSCMWTCLAWRSTTPFVLNGSRIFYCFGIQFWRYCGPLLHEFHNQHSFPVPGNNCHQLFGRLTTFVLTFLACLVTVRVSNAFTAFGFQNSQMKPRFHHLLLVWCDWEIHFHVRGIALKKSKPK